MKQPKTDQIEAYKWKPGQSGNPGGRPKKNPITDYLRQQLEDKIPQSMMDAMKEGPRAVFTEIYGPEPTFGQMIAFKLVQTSAKGDMFAMRELLDRVEGKVVQKSEVDLTIDDSLAQRLKEARMNALAAE